MRKLPALLLCLASLLCTSAQATVFDYSLSNKNPGGVFPPDYGLRLDNLFGTGGSAHWTFSFTQTDVRMVIDDVAKTARVFGDVVGGLDDNRLEWIAGVAGANIWNLDFTFNNITITDPSTGFWTASNTGGISEASGSGTLTFLDDMNIDGVAGSDIGRSIGLADYTNGAPGWFHIGGPNPQGPYVSSWLADTTWFTDDQTHSTVLNRNGACCKDFGYRAARVPEPASLMLMGLGLLGLFRVRRIA